MFDLWFTQPDVSFGDNQQQINNDSVFNKNLVSHQEIVQSVQNELIALISEADEWKNLLSQFKNLPSHFDTQMLNLGTFLNSSKNFRIQALKHLLDTPGIIPLVITEESFSHEFYKALNQLHDHTNVVIVDNTINLIEEHILIEKEEYLKNRFGFIGIQKHLCDKEIFDNWTERSFNFIRLGQFRSNMLEAEVAIRDADFLEFNINAIRFSDLAGNAKSNVCGFHIEEACSIMRYIGLNANLKALNLSGINGSTLQPERHYEAIALLLWYFMNGVSAKKDIIRKMEKSTNKEFIVHLEYLENPLKFIKNDQTNQWWICMEKKNDNTEKLIACSNQDYFLASQNEISNRILKILEMD